MGRFVQLPYVIGATTYDPLLEDFITVVGKKNLTTLEIKGTDEFLKNLRRNNLIYKFAFIHPFLGNSLTTKSYNLLDISKCDITFTPEVISVSRGLVFNTGTGTISNIVDSGINSIDSSIGMYFQNIVKTNSCMDIGYGTSTQRYYLIQYRADTGGYTFYAGSSVSSAILYSTNVSAIKLFIANVKDGMVSLWQDGAMNTSKAGGVSYAFPSLVYNFGAVNNSRIFSFSYLSTGLTDTEIQIMTSIVNNYMAALGRNV